MPLRSPGVVDHTIEASTLVIALDSVMLVFPRPITSVPGLVVIAIGVGLRLFG